MAYGDTPKCVTFLMKEKDMFYLDLSFATSKDTYQFNDQDIVSVLIAYITSRKTVHILKFLIIRNTYTINHKYEVQQLVCNKIYENLYLIS